MCIVGFEGTAEAVEFQRAAVRKVFAAFNAFAVGTKAGANWQEKKYDLPLIRDLCLDYGMWADVLECTVLWPKVIPCWSGVKKVLNEMWTKQGVKGFVGMHSAHQYKTGTCLYWTFASMQNDRSDINRFVETKSAVMEEILSHGGSLTHHHGVGFEYVPWMERYLGNSAVEALWGLKKRLDPRGICNPGKILPKMMDKEKMDKADDGHQKHGELFFTAGTSNSSSLTAKL